MVCDKLLSRKSLELLEISFPATSFNILSKLKPETSPKLRRLTLDPIPSTGHLDAAVINAIPEVLKLPELRYLNIGHLNFTIPSQEKMKIINEAISESSLLAMTPHIAATAQTRNPFLKNIKARDICRTICLLLIARRLDGDLCCIPKEIMLIISKLVWESRSESCWKMLVELTEVEQQEGVAPEEALPVSSLKKGTAENKNEGAAGFSKFIGFGRVKKDTSFETALLPPPGLPEELNAWNAFDVAPNWTPPWENAHIPSMDKTVDELADGFAAMNFAFSNENPFETKEEDEEDKGAGSSFDFNFSSENPFDAATNEDKKT